MLWGGRLAAAVVAGLLLLAATDDAFYRLTDPLRSHLPALALRKLESIVAFSLVGALVSRSWWRGAVVVGVFSGCIEIAQHLVGNEEPLRWNVFDLGCGVFGGAVGAATAGAVRHDGAHVVDVRNE